MARHLHRVWGIAVASALPLAGSAQAPGPLISNVGALPTSAMPAPLGGLPAIDLITLHAIGPGAPLRYGNVIVGSERVQLDGVQLSSGDDYTMDYATGVVYLKVSQHEGETLTVSYRYNTKADPKQINEFAGLGAFKYDLLPGGMTALIGLGMADREANGSVLQSNVFGFNNSFKMGQASVGGVYIFNNKSLTQDDAGMNFSGPPSRSGPPGPSSSVAGASDLILQHMATGAFGGSAQFDYQDVSKGFTSFGAAQAAGYDAATVAHLQSEKGMSRFGMSLKDMKFGALNVNESYRTVDDATGGIAWQSLGIAEGGLKVNWSSQRVDQNFGRFKDISETDHDQLGKEAGLDRQNLSAAFADKVAKISLTSTSIGDMATGNDIRHDEAVIDTGGIKFNLGDQNVSTGFSRFPSLLGPEQTQYGHEAGLHRQWMGMQAAVLGKNSPLTMSQSLVASSSGDLVSRDAAISGKSWSLIHTERGVDAGFTGMSALPAAELDTSIKAIARMYGPTTPSSPADRAAFMAGLGLSRSYTGLIAQPYKNWNLTMDLLDLKGRQDRGSLAAATLTGKNGTFSYRRQELGSKFTELTTMMGFEQQHLGAISGMDRTDVGMSLNFGAKKLNVASMTADTPSGGARRDSLAYSDKKIDVQMNQRSVDTGFANVASLVDPESATLSTMVGSREQDGRVKWQILPTMNLDASLQDSVNHQTNQASRLHQLALNWTPTAQTKFSYFTLEQTNHDPLSTLFADAIERLGVSQNLGRYGILTMTDERETFDKTITNLADYHREYFSYEAKITTNTSVKTEQSSTEFGDGEREDVSANTISTALSKRLGVSVTEMTVNHSGADATADDGIPHRDYGFWYDFGHGLMFSYGYARQLSANDSGTTVTTTTLGATNAATTPDKVGSVAPGTVGDMSVTGGYGTNEWDTGNRTQSFSNFSVAAVKPLHFGPLTNVKFTAALDSAADMTVKQKEDRLFSANGNVGAYVLGVDYKSQFDPASGYRAIDRSMRIQTDPSDKRWLHASVFYKERTLPSVQDVMIRDYNLSARLVRNLVLSNQLQTNPEVVQANALLGTVPAATRSDKWKLDFQSSANLTIGGSWEELINDQAKTLSRTGGFTAKLFEKQGSPLTLFMGVEQVDNPSLNRTTSRYSLEFDQHPGANQSFSIFAGNVSYLGTVADGFNRENWTVRLDYQFRF